MNKTLKIIFVMLIAYFGLILKANAFENGTLYNWDTIDTCDEKSGDVILYNNKHYMKNYKTGKRISGVAGYCLTPREPNAQNNYKVVELLNPTTDEFALAVYLAYNKLTVKNASTQKKYITQSDQNGAVVSTTMRLIASRYSRLSDAISKHTAYNQPYSHYKPYVLKRNNTVRNAEYFEGDSGKVALSVYYDVLNTLNDLSGTPQQKFDTLVNNGSLSVARWTTSYISQKSISSTQVEVNFSISSINVPSENINWNKFECGTNCSNLVKNGNGNFTATVPAGVTSFTIKTSQNTWKNYDWRFAIVKYYPEPESYQSLLLIDTTTYTSRSVVGVTMPQLPPPPPPACSIQTNPTTGARVYYGLSQTQVDVNTYRAQCVHNCQNLNGTYYCKNADLDYSGPVCSYEQWEEQCTYCGIYRKVCTANPNDPGCPKDYWQDCPICNPSANLPDSCNDFDTDSEIKGTINDLNVKKSSCNYSEYPVKGCVIGGRDIAGNAYEMIDALKNNRYCRAYCIEDYSFDIPTAKHSTSGGYFDLEMKITGTRNCYLGPPRDNPKKDVGVSTETIDYNKFKNDVITTNNNIASYYAAGNYGMALNLSNELNKMINEYKECSTVANKWLNNMKFEPRIEYTYNDYINKYNKGTFSKVEGTETTKVTNTFCYGSTDSKYICNGSKIETEQDVPLEDWAYENYSYYVCTGTSAAATCTIKQDKINKAIGVQKSLKKEAIFAPSQNFSTYHQYGTVKTGSVCENANVSGYKNCLWTRLPETALPVELKTGRGAFPYTIKISDVGQYSNGTLGRLMGNSNSVLNKFNELESGKRCVASEDPNDSTPKYSKYTQNIGYVCGYINNCDECNASCEGDSCEMKTCEGCKVNCRTCIFDGNNNTYKYRTVSLNNLFPNKCLSESSTECREAGYNWNSKKAATNGASKKAEVTIEEIEKSGENAYEEDKNYSYTITPMQLRAIREYNKEAGTYANTQMPHNDVFKNDEVALQCEQVTYDNGITYSVKCISTFLNDTSETYFTSNMQRSDTSKFTLWTETDYCLKGGCLSKVDGIGPSWK